MAPTASSRVVVVSFLALPAIRAIHFLTSTIVHGLLLFLQLTNTLTQCHTVRHVTRFSFALTGMDLEKGPDSLTYVATASSLDAALLAVLQKSLHLGAVCRRTFCGVAR